MDTYIFYTKVPSKVEGNKFWLSLRLIDATL